MTAAARVAGVSRPDAVLVARLRSCVGTVVGGDEMVHVLRVAAQVARVRAAAAEARSAGSRVAR